MSLKVWLPLDGDLRNLGASDIEVTNNGATVDNAGKIGKCYNFDGVDDNFTFTPKVDGWSEISISIWACPTSANPTGGLFSLEYSSNWQLTLRGTVIDFRDNSIGVGGNRKTYSIGSFLANTWTHIVVTYNIGILKIYRDGILLSTNNVGGTALNTGINNGRIGSTVQSGYYFNGKINDVRIYDHCLSAAEVKEIAMGLVLHYKLDNPYIEGTTNLFTENPCKNGSLASHGSFIENGKGVKIDWTSNAGDTYWYLKLKEQNLIEGETYTLSFQCFGLGNTVVTFRWCNLANYTVYLKNGFNSYTFNMPSTNITNPFFDDVNRDTTLSNLQLWNFQLEKKDHATPYTLNSRESSDIIQDSSGYGHNAILTNGSLTADTPRYSKALILDSSTKAIGTPIFKSGVFIPEYTWAGWVKRNYTTAATKRIHANIADISLYTDFTPYISWTSGKTDGSTTGNGAAGGTKIATLNEWVHMAITYKSGIGKFYINGELIKTWNYTSQGVYIAAAENNTLGNGFIGNLSDIRIYITELLDTDIKLLYNVGMRVDNLQNLHTFEYKENTSNLFRSELIMPWAKANRTRIGEIVSHNNTYALNIAQEPFYKNISDSISGALDGMFIQNTSYIFDMWIDTDSVISNNNNVKGGMIIRYSDNSIDNTFVFTGGNKGYQHKVLITPSNKTVQRLEFYYYISTDVFYRIDSCICPLSNLKLHKTGIFEGTNLLEETNTKLIKNALIETNEIIEI